MPDTNAPKQSNTFLMPVHQALAQVREAVLDPRADTKEKTAVKAGIDIPQKTSRRVTLQDIEEGLSLIEE